MQVYYLDNRALLESAAEDIGRDMIADPLQRIYPIYQGYNDESRRYLAETIYENTVAEVPELEVREAQPVLTGDYAFLRCMGIDSVLIEMGFLSNDTDRALLQDPEGQERVARGIANGVYNYYCVSDDSMHEADAVEDMVAD